MNGMSRGSEFGQAIRGELRDEVLMNMAREVARLSTCNRLKVGAILTKDYRVISTGYNGTPSGMPHCSHSVGETGGCKDAVHAEANSIAFAARLGGSGTMDSTLYVTHSPCMECAKLIINAGISRVVYGEEYRLVEGLELLRDAGIWVTCRITGSSLY